MYLENPVGVFLDMLAEFCSIIQKWTSDPDSGMHTNMAPSLSSHSVF